MLHLIEQMLPAPAHRLGLRIAHPIRHRWRQWRKAPLIGCNIVVKDLKGEILLLRHSYGPPVWAFPGGGVGRAENPMAAAERELMEELSLGSSNLKSVGSIEGIVSGSPHITHLFELTTDKIPKPDKREVVEARFFPTHSLPEPLGPPTREQLQFWQKHCLRTD